MSSGPGWKGCCGPTTWVALNAVLWFGGGASTAYLATRPEPYELDSNQRERMEKALKGLDLSDEQWMRIEEAREQCAARMVEADEALSAELRSIESWFDQELRKVLTQEQRDQLPRFGGDRPPPG